MTSGTDAVTRKVDFSPEIRIIEAVLKETCVSVLRALEYKK